MNITRNHKFGPEFQQLLLTAFANAPFRFPFVSEGKAQSFKTRVNLYFRCLREENIRLDLIEMADSLSIVVDGSALVFQSREDNWDHTAIRELLGLSKGFAKITPDDGSELQVPDLLQNRLVKQLSEIRARKAGSTKIVTPYDASPKKNEK